MLFFLNIINILYYLLVLLLANILNLIFQVVQFEAGKEYINKNGVVKDKKVHLKVIEKIL